MVLLGDVEHVHDDDHRNAHFDELSREVEVALEVRGVDDVDDGFGFTREDVVARDAFVFARRSRRGDGVDARKVDELDLGILVFELAGLLIDRHAGPVAHALVGTRQCVEECGLAAIRIADHAYDVLTHFRFQYGFECVLFLMDRRTAEGSAAGI